MSSDWNSNLNQALVAAHDKGIYAYEAACRMHDWQVNNPYAGTLERWAWELGWRWAEYVAQNRGVRGEPVRSRWRGAESNPRH